MADSQTSALNSKDALLLQLKTNINEVNNARQEYSELLQQLDNLKKNFTNNLQTIAIIAEKVQSNPNYNINDLKQEIKDLDLSLDQKIV